MSNPLPPTFAEVLPTYRRVDSLFNNAGLQIAEDTGKLLASANDIHPAGLGTSSGLVGRHLMLHNNSSLIAFSKTPNPTKFQKTPGFNDYYFGADDWEYPLGSMQMLAKSDAVLIGFDAPEAEDPADLARHSLDFWLTTGDLPLPANRVTVGPDGRISLRYTPTNLKAHQRLRQKFTGMLDQIRCRDQVLESYSYRGDLIAERLGARARTANGRHARVSCPS